MIDSPLLHFSKEFLQAYGCVNCIWKESAQCPEGLTKPSESVADGYCSKLTNFLLSLSSKDDSISAVKEKFHIFIQEMQVLTDRKDYLILKNQYTSLRSQRGLSSGQLSELTRIEIEMNGYKIWWMKLSDSVVKGLSRIADREKKVQTDLKPQLTLQQLNILLKDNAPTLIGIDDDETYDTKEKEE